MSSGVRQRRQEIKTDFAADKPATSGMCAANPPWPGHLKSGLRESCRADLSLDKNAG
jgi:hypothetical protein